MALPLEAPAAGLVEITGVEDLHGDQAAERRLERPVHDGEPASADELGVLQAAHAEIHGTVVHADLAPTSSSMRSATIAAVDGRPDGSGSRHSAMSSASAAGS